MNIYATIREVSGYYSMPAKTGYSSWQLTMPHDITKPRCATCAASVSGSYNKALEKRRSYIAYDVVILATQDSDKAYSAMYDVSEQGYSIAVAVKRNIV